MNNLNNEMQVHNIPMKEIYADPEMNCRGEVVPYDCIELANSIKTSGLQQPIAVQPFNKTVDNVHYKYRIIMGHRRYVAFQINQSETIPAIIKEGLSEVQARILNLQENLERKDLNLMQEALAIKKFAMAGYTMQEVAKMVGMSMGWVQVRFVLLKLEPEIQDAAGAGFLTQEQVKDIYSISGKDARFEAVKKIKESRLKGEKRAIKVKKPKKNPLAKKARSKEEINEMTEFIVDNIGGNFGSRCLAWAAGEINDLDLYRDMKELAEDLGKPTFNIPTHYYEAIEN
jgi:ParB family chromosome partitioning protein